MIFNRDETGLRNALRSELLQSFPEKCTPLMYAVLLGDLNMVGFLSTIHEKVFFAFSVFFFFFEGGYNKSLIQGSIFW